MKILTFKSILKDVKVDCFNQVSQSSRFDSISDWCYLKLFLLLNQLIKKNLFKFGKSY